MAVVSEFSAVPVKGFSPLTVQFTDESTGSPTNWLWDFGDGEFSNEQHPEHIYIGETADKFTVKLSAWISTGSSWLSLSTISQRLKNGWNSDSNQEARDSYDGESWAATGGTNFQRFRCVKNGPYWYYDCLEVTQGFTVPAGPNNTSIMEFNYAAKAGGGDWFPEGEGSHNMNAVTMNAGDYPVFQSQFLMDVSHFQGSGLNTIVPDMETLNPGLRTTPTGFGDAYGIAGQFRVKEWTATDKDVEEKIDYIEIGPPLEADFTGDPLEGESPLSVQFTNLTTPTDPPPEKPITFSWKYRVSNSGDDYVEFSTVKHPLTIFNK